MFAARGAGEGNFSRDGLSDIYVRTGKFPNELSKNMRNSLRRKAEKFLVRDGLLFYRDTKRNALVCDPLHTFINPSVGHVRKLSSASSSPYLPPEVETRATE